MNQEQWAFVIHHFSKLYQCAREDKAHVEILQLKNAQLEKSLKRERDEHLNDGREMTRLRALEVQLTSQRDVAQKQLEMRTEEVQRLQKEVQSLKQRVDLEYGKRAKLRASFGTIERLAQGSDDPEVQQAMKGWKDGLMN